MNGSASAPGGAEGFPEAYYETRYREKGKMIDLRCPRVKDVDLHGTEPFPITISATSH